MFEQENLGLERLFNVDYDIFEYDSLDLEKLFNE